MTDILNKKADDIYTELHMPEKSVEKFNKESNNIFKCDAASLFVALAYLENPVSDDGEKEKLRCEAYRAFFAGNKNKYKNSWKAIDMLCGINNSLDSFQIKIRILKGGSYKIKQYYLENSELQEIRGASNLLTYVEENKIPDMIAERYIRECIIYNGGGNILALLPEDCDEGFALSLEQEAGKILVSAGIAYYVSDTVDAGMLFGNDYRNLMSSIENKLNERKKLIITNPIDRISDIYGDTIRIVDEEVQFRDDINSENVKNKSGEICSSCGKRYAYYQLDGRKLCASCLHKRCVGKEVKKSRYINEYKHYNNGNEPEFAKTLMDIAGESGNNEKYIAVVYGDGNNMGGIIQHFSKITDMMSFSRDVKTIANKAVFEAMGAVGIKRFEVVGLGGDDVFVIIPGNKACNFAVKLIEKYNEQFTDKDKDKNKYEDVSTMSVGIAIGKAKMPINILIETAEARLSDAKRLSRINKDKKCDDGSMAYTIMDTFEGEKEKDISAFACNTLQPYSTSTANSVLRLVNSFKSSTGKTRIRNLLNAFANAESPEEAALFFDYLNAKSDKKVTLKKISGYELCKDHHGYYRKDKELYYIWKDIIDLSDFCD